MVPGALEIVPAIAIAVEAAARQKKPYDGAVALGCVIQGETFHFDIVSMQSARGADRLLGRASVPGRQRHPHRGQRSAGWARARLTEGDKGGDAARAALALIELKRQRAKR